MQVRVGQLLLRHPKIQKPPSICGRVPALKCLTEIFPRLRAGRSALQDFSVDAVASSGAGRCFSATPHEASLELVPQLLNAGLRVVDLSGAFRFRDPETFARWYKLPAPARTGGGSRLRSPELYADQLPRAPGR